MHRATLFALLVLSVLQACVQGASVEYSFTDTQMFYDISLYNFYLGRNQNYEYKLTARPGKQVNLYLFQNNHRRYSKNVYDGQNDQATPIAVGTKNIPSNTDIVEEPLPISSTGRYMFIRIKADTTNAATLDFQAMATDYVQPKGCSSLVNSVNKADSSHTFIFDVNAQGGCYFVVHANDPTNSPLLQQSLQNGFKSLGNKFIAYKGLTTDKKHALISTNKLSDLYVSDKYMVVHLTESINLGYIWTLLPQLDVNEGVGPYAFEALMSNDYYQDLYPTLPNQLTQNFVSERYDIKRIQVNFLNLGGSMLPSAPTVYKAANFKAPFNITFGDCDQAVLKYTTDNRQIATGSGFYATYQEA